MKTGDKITLKNKDYYKSSKVKEPVGRLTGEYYYWNESPLNGRIRIAKTLEDCGEKDKYVGWIIVEETQVTIQDSREKEVDPKVEIAIEEPAVDPHEDEECFEEEITRKQSLWTISEKYYGNLAGVEKLMKDNNLTLMLLPWGTKIKVWVKKRK